MRPGVSFQMLFRHAVRLPESFRGGCSFGAGAEADLSRRDVFNSNMILSENRYPFFGIIFQNRYEGNTGLPRLSTQAQHY